MTSWILQYFLNPAYFWPGLALVAAPIVIHLINRLNYRRVRFAAMEFLLASQKRNRRKVLLEQLLLLLLRVAMMVLIVALLARLIIDPSQLSLFQGARSQHVVILDDTASMRDQRGDSTVFDTAKDVIRRIAAEGARRPGSQLLTLILMSTPDKSVAGLSERVVDEALLSEVTERLMTISCSHQTADPAEVLEAARRRLADDRSSVRHVHVLSDFREIDWLQNKSALAVLKEMDQTGLKINLVRCVADGQENLGVVDLGGAVEVAAARVPVTLSASVRNWGSREARDVRASVFVNDMRLPRSIDFQTIAPGDTAQRNFDVVFDEAKPSRVRVTIGDDPLSADNERFLAVAVPEENPVLIVDGSPGAEQARYIADALAADRSVTGFAPDIRIPEDLRRIDLSRFPLIYLINVPQLEPDAVAALENYVRSGGGLVWYMGDAVQPGFYNQTLFRKEGGLFPVQLGPAPVQLQPEQNAVRPPPPNLKNSPQFALLLAGEVPILDLVTINLLYPLAASGDSSSIADDVEVVATLQNRPLMLEHRYGAGRVFTCLTSAGPLANPEGVVWSNWASGPAGFSFVVLQLELTKQLIGSDRGFPQWETGTPLELTFNPALFQRDLEIVSPSNQITHLQAEPISSAATSQTELRGSYQDTDQPGIYTVVLTGQDREQDRRLYALNVPAREGALAIADDAALLDELRGSTSIQLQAAGNFDWIRSESPGSEVRWFLLILLALISIGEQALASRLSNRNAA